MVRFRDTRDPALFEELYEDSRLGLLSWIVRRSASMGLDVDPMELLQDTFVNIYRYAGTFREERGNGFGGWARTIAANVVRRARGRRGHSLSFQALPKGAEPQDEADGPHQSLELTEERRALNRAWVILLLHYAAAERQLSSRDREALHLVEVEGLSYADVARRLKVRSSNMKMIIFRSRKRLCALMGRAFSVALAHGARDSRGSRVAG